jgi:hypothetical protein
VTVSSGGAKAFPLAGKPVQEKELVVAPFDTFTGSQLLQLLFSFDSVITPVSPAEFLSAQTRI